MGNKLAHAFAGRSSYFMRTRSTSNILIAKRSERLRPWLWQVLGNLQSLERVLQIVGRRCISAAFLLKPLPRSRQQSTPTGLGVGKLWTGGANGTLPRHHAQLLAGSNVWTLRFASVDTAGISWRFASHHLTLHGSFCRQAPIHPCTVSCHAPCVHPARTPSHSAGVSRSPPQSTERFTPVHDDVGLGGHFHG